MSYSCLIFGKNILSSMSILQMKRDDVEVNLIPFPDKYNELDRLSNYDIVIFDYAAFFIKTTHYKEKEKTFIKQMLEASEKGTTFCILHNAEPKFTKEVENMAYLGYHLCKILKLEAKRSGYPIFDGEIRNQVFQSFLKKWGTSHYFFNETNEDFPIIPLYQAKDHHIVGFSASLRKSVVLYLPFQVNKANINDLSSAFECLIDSIISFRSTSFAEIPEWATSPFFQDEEKLVFDIKKLEEEQYQLNNELQQFEEAKTILIISIKPPALPVV